MSKPDFEKIHHYATVCVCGGGGGGGQGGMNSISCTPDEKIVHLLGLFFHGSFELCVFFIGRQANSFVRKNQYWLPELHLSRLFAHSVEGITRSISL